MSERISALMDGELEAHERGGPNAGLALEGDALEAWRTYHLVGDALRDTAPLSAGFAARMQARLAAEPSVLAPRAPRKEMRPKRRALQIAAGLAAVAMVGWMALVPRDGVQRAPEVALAPASGTSPIPAKLPVEPLPAKVPLPSATGDYLLAHQAYSPRGNLQGVAPYVRTVSESVRLK